MSSSRSTTSDRWLHSVITAYDSLSRQWSAFLTMMQSSPPHGWQVSLTPFDSIPKLLVSVVPPSSPRTGVGTVTSSDTPFSYGGTNTSSWTVTDARGTSLVPVPPPPSRVTKTAVTQGKSTTSKRATCRGARASSGT